VRQSEGIEIGSAEGVGEGCPLSHPGEVEKEIGPGQELAQACVGESEEVPTEMTGGVDAGQEGRVAGCALGAARNTEGGVQRTDAASTWEGGPSAVVEVGEEGAMARERVFARVAGADAHAIDHHEEDHRPVLRWWAEDSRWRER